MYCDLRTISRFCIAREFNRAKTVEMWRNWIKWYESYRPDLIKPEEEIINKIHSSGKYRYVGFDKEGCPVLLIRMRYHIKGLANVEENFRYLIFMIEQGVKLAQSTSNFSIYSQKLTKYLLYLIDGTWQSLMKYHRKA